MGPNESESEVKHDNVMNLSEMTKGRGPAVFVCTGHLFKEMDISKRGLQLTIGEKIKTDIVVLNELKTWGS